MPSKFDAVLSDLKPAPVADQKYQDKVEVVKKTFGVSPAAVDLAAAYVVARQEKTRAEARLYDANLHLEAVTQLLEDSQSAGAEGWGQYGVANNALRMLSGETIRVHHKPYGVVKDKEAYRLWCVANGYERNLMLWPTKTQEIARERAVAGDPPPDGTEIFSKASVELVKAKA